MRQEARGKRGEASGFGHQASEIRNQKPGTRHQELASENCNIFTLVGSAECRVMSDELKNWIELLISWILTAFLSFVPKMKGCWMGTGQNGDKGRSVPADFFHNLRKFLSFSSLTTDYRLLPTASSPPLLFRGQSLSKSGHSLSKQGLSLSKQGHSLSKSGHSLSPQALSALSWKRIAPIFQKRLEA